MSQDFYSRDIDFEWDSYTLNMDYDLGFGAVTAIVGYQETDESVPTDFDGEDTGARLQRRERNWIPNVRIGKQVLSF